jgi:hypothetical protein
MLLVTPKENIEWEEMDALVATIHHLAMGNTVNAVILSLGGEKMMFGIHCRNTNIEQILRIPFSDYLHLETYDGSYELEMLKPFPEGGKVLHLHPPKLNNNIIHPPVIKDPLITIYSALGGVSKNEIAGISWLLKPKEANYFESHGVVFATSTVDWPVISYVAAAYATLGFKHATEPLFPKVAWKNIFSDIFRLRKTFINKQLLTQVLNPPI